MRKAWTVSLLMLVPLISMLFVTDPASGVEAELERDEYFISVNPDDDLRGVLEVKGEIDPGTLGLLESLSVTLSAVVNEVRNGEPTGRTWHAEVAYDDAAIGGGAKLFRKGDGPEPFTVTLDPDLHDPERDEGIPVPTGIGDEYEGRMVVTAAYSGTGVESGETTARATIYPEPYHLINLTTPDDPVEMEASDRLIYSLSIKNAGTIDESVILEVPLLEDLEELGFDTSLESGSIELLRPGEKVSLNLTIKAPLEIEEDRSQVLVISAYTVAEDPQTLEPASSRRIEIDLNLVKSRIEKPDPPKDDDTDDDDPFKPSPSPGTEPIGADENTEPWMVVLAIGFIVVIVVVLAIFFFRRGGDGDEENVEDAHASNFRI